MRDVVGARLQSFLRAAGAADADIEQAEVEGWLPVLVLDRVLMPGAPRYDAEALAVAAGVDPETLQRLWRALGFPDVPEGLALFSDLDLEALQRLLGRVHRSPLGAGGELERPERPARVISAALARIAAYEAELLATALDELRAAGLDDEAAALALLETFKWDDLEWLIDYVHRLQLRAAAWRRLTTSSAGNAPELGVGFVDLSGYTELSEELDDEGLAELLDQFDTVAFDTVAELGGRVVKTIGDEIMFVGPPDAVVDISLAILARARRIEALPSVRIGVAFGSVLARDGDYFGPVVNLASRITDRARPGTILASESLREVMGADPRCDWHTLRTRRIRGIGEVRLFALREASV
jgi:adenylate cyclase